MYPLLRTLIRICLLQEGPQDLPASPRLLATLVILSWTGNLFVIEQLETDAAVPVYITLVTLFALGFIWVGLSIRGGRARFMQTAAALFGTNLVLLLPIGPLLLLTAEGDYPTLQLLVLLAWIWSIAIKGHIFRHALNLPLAGGVLVAVVYTLLSLLIPGG